MEQEPRHNEEITGGFDYQSLSQEEQSRLVTLKSGQKVILTPDNNPTKAFDPKTGEFIDILPDDISEQRA